MGDCGNTQKAMRPILIVDDEPLLREMLAEALSEYTVEIAGDGRTALEMINSQEFELIITDLMMPGVDGFDILRTVQGKDEPTAVLVLTGYPSSDNKDRCFALGCRTVIAKPFNLASVRSEVRRFLDAGKEQNEATEDAL